MRYPTSQVCVSDRQAKCKIEGILYMGLVARKPVFDVSEKASFKPVSSATETG